MKNYNRISVFAFTSCTAIVALGLLAGCAAETDDSSEGTESSVNSDPRVNVRIGAFIPCSALSSPEPRLSHYYAGDNRGFDYALVTTRSRIALDGWADPTRTQWFSAFVGESRAYEGSEISGRGPGQCYTLAPDARVARRGRGNEGRVIGNSQTYKDSSGRTVAHVELALHEKNPLAWFSPYLDADVDIYIEYATNADGKQVPSYYWVDGVHDGFPAYEIYLDGKPIYRYDGLSLGHDPFWLDSDLHDQERVKIARTKLQR